MNPLLELKNIHAYYGGVIHALKGVDLTVNEGEVVTLIGANGAGKTTLLKCISNILKIKSGDILFKSQNLKTFLPQKIVSLGLAHVPEGRGIFKDLTVLENLELGAYLRKDRAEIKKDLEKMFGMFSRLDERKSQMAGTLSGGEQQMLAIARGLMSRPALLLLDEPSLGLAPLLIQKIFEIIGDINQKQATSILIVEQNAYLALKNSHRAYVMETGKITMSGKSTEVMESPDIQKAYLG